MYKNAAIQYYLQLSIFFNDCNNITDEKKMRMKKYSPKNLFLKVYKHNKWYKKDEEKGTSYPEETIAERAKLRTQKADDNYLSDVPPLEADTEVNKRRKKLKNLNSKQIIN